MSSALYITREVAAAGRPGLRPRAVAWLIVLMSQRSVELTVVPVPGHGAEDVLIAGDGTVYTGTDDGSVFAVDPGGDQIRRVGRTGGRPLGLEWLNEGELLVCDARRGLLALGLADGHVRVLADSVGGQPMLFCNNAAVLDDGSVWFTDSSTRWGIDEWKSDLIENTCTGRLLRLGPGESAPEVVLGGLSFANGVARTADGSEVIVAETGHRRLRRVAGRRCRRRGWRGVRRGPARAPGQHRSRQ